MSNFNNAKNLYLDKLKITQTKTGASVKWDPNSVYAKCAREGLCFRCKREDLEHRPKAQVFAFCDSCMAELSIGYEKVEQQAKQELRKWFKD